MPIHFKIIIPCYNVAQFIAKALTSVKDQSYQNFKCIIIDDASTDGTSDIARTIINGDTRFTLIQNHKKASSHLQNLYKGICIGKPENSDVIVNLDGDDRLYGEHALKILNDIYIKNQAWMTYCSFIDTNGNRWGLCDKPIPEQVYNDNSFRSHPWQSTHLRSYKFGLFKKIKFSDFISPSDGDFFKAAVDVAIMMPMLEMAGIHAVYVHDILYEYNLGNPLTLGKQGKQWLQTKHSNEIKAFKPYARLSSIEENDDGYNICHVFNSIIEDTFNQEAATDTCCSGDCKDHSNLLAD